MTTCKHCDLELKPGYVGHVCSVVRYDEPERQTALYRVVHSASGQFYVGISVDPVRRWKTHRKRARQGHESKFYLALQQHGADAFTFKVLDWFDTWQQAREAERLILKWGLAELNMTR